MERHDGSEHGSAETHLIQGTELNPHLNTTPPLEQIETMDSDGNPKFIFDQGLYYPAATNYYGYYCTAPGESNDQQRFFEVDGRGLQYAGVQSENLPYVYYAPSYRYVQSPYNPYNPYIPGAIIGIDGSFLGTQQYYPGPPYQNHVSSPPYNPYIPGAIIGIDGSFLGTQQYYPGPPYQNHVSSPAYCPLAVQPRPDGIPNSFLVPHSLNADASNCCGPHVAVSSEFSGGVRVELAGNCLSQSHHSDKSSEELKSNAVPIKQPAELKSTTSGTVPHSDPSQISQVESVSGSTQTANQFLIGGISSSRPSPVKVAPVGNGLPNFRSNGRGWAVDKLRPRLHHGGVSKNRNGNENLDSLSEQNRGPRTSRSKSQWASSISVEAYSDNVEATTAQENIIILTDLYNKKGFSLNYAEAKFFVIKSYGEDDVHRSIKYNVWSSTPNGNKKLDNAYEDAQRIAAEKRRSCPLFLLFSVNASGQFCGVAEMVGHVDFHKDMHFWHQGKWIGSFPVKWHMIKDVPNNNFRHIILENKPVTNCRDTQEIKRMQGLEMLYIFKNHALKTSILDDFIYYEEREREMHEEKNRNLGKASTLFVPAFVPAVSSNEKFSSKSENQEGGDANHITTVLRIGSLTVHPKQAETKAPLATPYTEAIDVITVGSIPIKVKRVTEASALDVLTIGTIPVIPKTKIDKLSSSSFASDGVRDL